MIPIPIFWTVYSTTEQGRSLKFVPCENCFTEYVYVMERECSGVGTSMYNLSSEDVAGHAESAAGDTLTAVLENDFDPVPCPACGHYQRFMFPKLLGDTGQWVRIALFVMIGIGCLAAVNVLHRSVVYLQRPSEHSFARMSTAWSVFLPLCVAGLGLSILNKAIIRRFNPNDEDQQTRIAIGQSRAVTRAQFDQAQLEKAQETRPGGSAF